MNSEQTIRAWKDEDYRLSLSETELAALPEHPSGLISLSMTDLDKAAGGTIDPIFDVLIHIMTSNLSCDRSCPANSSTCKVFGAGC